VKLGVQHAPVQWLHQFLLALEEEMKAVLSNMESERETDAGCRPRALKPLRVAGWAALTLEEVTVGLAMCDRAITSLEVNADLYHHFGATYGGKTPWYTRKSGTEWPTP